MCGRRGGSICVVDVVAASLKVVHHVCGAGRQLVRAKDTNVRDKSDKDERHKHVRDKDERHKQRRPARAPCVCGRQEGRSHGI